VQQQFFFIYERYLNIFDIFVILQINMYDVN